MPSVRELVRSMQVEIRDTDLQPERAADLLNRLCALTGNIADEIREADMEYARVLLQHLEAEARANRAKIKAETTPEYSRKREARDLKDLATEMIGSLKYYLRAKAEELRDARYAQG